MKNNQMEQILGILTNIDNRLKKVEAFVSDGSESRNLERRPPQVFTPSVKGLAEKAKIPEDKVGEIYDVDSDKSLTLVKLPGADEREKIRNATVLVILGYKYILGIEDVPSKEIRRNLAENGVDINNFATYLNEIVPSLVRRKGKPKSPNTAYRLTVPGEVQAKTLLKDLLNG